MGQNPCVIGQDPVTSQGPALARDLDGSGTLTGRVLRSCCRGGSVREFPVRQRLRGGGVGEGTGPCRKDGENLGPLEGLDLEAGRACWAT